jgi:hypothetical protein
MNDYCDYDMPKFMRVSEHVSRKQHRCCECHAPILVGEKYVRITGKWDGEMNTFRQHDLCARACEFVRGTINQCLCFGELFEFDQEAWEMSQQDSDTFKSMMDQIKARQLENRQ